MPNNHVILGLGGTGGNIIRAFRTLLWQEHRNKEPRWWAEKEGRWSDPIANMGYLYVDSSDKELNRSDGLWQCLGESLVLDKNQKLLIRDANLEASLTNLAKTPGISGWIGAPDVLQVMIQNSRGSEGANQLRRFGRYLFAQSAKRYEERIKELVQRLTEGGTAKVTFHVCCTLGCGTGSGSIVDAISILRKNFPNGDMHPIFLYVLVTDQYVRENVGFFYPNQYAALCELNALRQGLWQPHDVLAFEVRRLEKLSDNFQSCFLIGPINERGEVSSKEEQEQMIASYLYQKTVTLHNLTPRSLHQAETFEDFRAYSALLQDRCTTFGSFGIKRFRIPEAEIREKLSYTFGIQAVLQFLYNNWSDNGFLKSELNRDLPELVTDPESNQRWYLTDEHLKLSKDFVLTGGKEWPGIQDEWTEAMGARRDLLLKFRSASRDDRKIWLGEIREFAKTYYEKNFRNRGVEQYYADKREAILDYAREIRRKLEIDLFERWRVGDDSVTDTERIHDALIKHLEQRKSKLSQQKDEAAKLEKKATERIREAEDKWDRVGWLTDWLTIKPAQILGEYTIGQIDKYTADTERVACDFARDLVQQVIAQLTDARNNLTRVKAFFAKLADRYEKEVSARIRADERINYRAKDVRLIEPEQISQTIRALQINPKIQGGQCAKGRQEIAAALGAAAEEQTFSSFAKKLNQDELDRIVFRTCDQAAVTAHAALFSGNPTELRRILGRNVVEKLYEQFPTVTQELKLNIEALVQSSAACLGFEGQETQPSVIFHREMPDMPQRAIVVFMPKTDHLKTYREELKKAFEGAFEEKVEVVDSEHSPNEILLVSVCFWFELRFIKPLTVLRERYEEFLKADIWSGVHQIHLENHRAPIQDRPSGGGLLELPRLNLLSGRVSPSLAFKYLLLGQVLGFIQTETNARGISTLLYARRASDGFPLGNVLDLATPDVEEASKRLEWGVFEKVQMELDGVLRDSCQEVAKKRDLCEKLDSLCRSKFKERGGKALDPLFKAFQAKIEEVKAMVNEVQL